MQFFTAIRKYFSSKTMWAAMLIMALGGLEIANSYITDPKTMGIMLLVIGKITMLLRLITTKAIWDK